MKEMFKIVGCVAVVIIMICVMMFGYPYYNVWSKGMNGRSKLMEAEQTKQILVQTAQAEKDSAQLRADAIKIMGQAAKEYPEYRQQEFMASFGEALREGNIQQIIYVPTEANIPIMEARNK